MINIEVRYDEMLRKTLLRRRQLKVSSMFLTAAGNCEFPCARVTGGADEALAANTKHMEDLGHDGSLNLICGGSFPRGVQNEQKLLSIARRLERLLE